MRSRSDPLALAAWDQVRLTTPASFALALLAADKATVAHGASLVYSFIALAVRS